MNCKYCNSAKQDGAFCLQCGAPMSSSKPIKRESWKSDPFFYNGFICYQLRDHAKDTYEVQFWLGMELQERIEVTSDILDFNVGYGEATMPFFWNLFLLAKGEKDVIKYQELNKKFPASFEIRRIENPEKERVRGLSMFELAQESKG